MKRFIFLLILIASTFALKAEEKSNDPHISGVIRAKYEYNIEQESSRFDVRNARYKVDGTVRDRFYYKAELDLSDEGTLKMLDAYVGVKLYQGLKFHIGQVKIPFSTDNLRSPGDLKFLNRSFIAKQISSVLRDIGCMMIWEKPFEAPLDISLGVFNGVGINKPVLEKNKSLGGRIIAYPFKNFNVSGNYFAGKFQGNDVKFADVGIGYRLNNWFIETEYAERTQNDSTSKAMFATLLYDINIGNEYIVKKITPGIRYDFMTPYTTNNIEPARITVGTTFFFDDQDMTYIRLDYENYLYDNVEDLKGYKDWANLSDKVSLEFVVKF